MLHLLLPLPQANAIDILSTKKVHQACKSDSKTTMGKKERNMLLSILLINDVVAGQLQEAPSCLHADHATMHVTAKQSWVCWQIESMGCLDKP